MYKRILIPVSPESTHQEAIAEGVSLAKVHDAEVIFATVLPRYVLPAAEMPMLAFPGPKEFIKDAQLAAQRVLASATAVAEASGVRSKTAIGTGIDDAVCIFDMARKRRCSLIVVGSVGRNAVMRIVSGSVIPGLITLSTIPVLVVRAHDGKHGRKRSVLTHQRRVASRRRPPQSA